MKRRKKQGIFLLLVFSLLLCGCQKHNDGPPDPGTPEPAPLTGEFVSEHGSFTFDGDGKTVYVDLDDELGAHIPDGIMEYFFKWGSFGLCRYDVAMLGMEGRQYDFKVRSASENRISLDYRDGSVQYELDFVREGAGEGSGKGAGEGSGKGAGEGTGEGAGEEMQDISLDSFQGEWSDLNGSTTMVLNGDRLTIRKGEYTETYTVVLKKESV